MAVERKLYVALIGDDLTNTKTLLSQGYALDLPFSRDTAREALQRYITKGDIHEAGTYLICTPRETSINGHLFTVIHEPPPDPLPSPYQIVD